MSGQYPTAAQLAQQQQQQQRNYSLQVPPQAYTSGPSPQQQQQRTQQPSSVQSSSASHPPSSSQASHAAAAAAGSTTGSAAQPSSRPQAVGPVPYSQQYASAFRQSVDSFFHGLDGFLTANEAIVAANGQPTPSNAPNPDELLQKLYQRYMQVEVETDNLSMYLSQTEMKLRAEMAEPQVTQEQLQAQQARYLAQQKEAGRKTFPPLPPTLALFRAQYELHAHPTSAKAAGGHDAAAGTAAAAPQSTPTSSQLSSAGTGVAHASPRTPASSQLLLTPNQLTPNQPLSVSPQQPTQQSLTPNASATQMTTADQSADVEIL